MGKNWETYGKPMGKIWETYGKQIEKHLGNLWEKLGNLWEKLGNIFKHGMEMVVSINGTTPKWMVDFMEHPNLKWMMTGGCPHFRKPPYGAPSDEHLAQWRIWTYRGFLLFQAGGSL